MRLSLGSIKPWSGKHMHDNGGMVLPMGLSMGCVSAAVVQDRYTHGLPDAGLRHEVDRGQGVLRKCSHHPFVIRFEHERTLVLSIAVLADD